MFDRQQRERSPFSWRPRHMQLVVLVTALFPVAVAGGCGGAGSASGTSGTASGGAGGGGLPQAGAAGGIGGGTGQPSPSASGGAGGGPTAGSGAGGATSAGGAGGLAVVGGTGSGGSGGITSSIPMQGTGGNGTISWTGNGVTHTSTGYYEESRSADGTSFDIVIASDAQASGAACSLTGRFAALPPPEGSYQMADFNLPQAEGTFVARCETGSTPYAAEDQSVSGQVIISQSVPGAIEGAFVMHAGRSVAGTGGISGTVVYSGAFSVGCRDRRPTTDPSCGAQTAASP